MSSAEDEENGMKIGFDRSTYGFNHNDLEDLGERAVRDKFNRGGYGHPGLPVFTYVAAWLADKEFVRRENEAKERDERERLTLRSAKIANLLAIAAILFSIISLALNLDG